MKTLMKISLALGFGLFLMSFSSKTAFAASTSTYYCDGINVPVSSATAAVSSDYVAYLHRTPDPGGLAYWVGTVVNCQNTMGQVANFIATSPEAICGGHIMNLYESCLGRAPDGSPGIWGSGPEYWVSECLAGVSASVMENGFLTSAECASKPAICQPATCHD